MALIYGLHAFNDRGLNLLEDENQYSAATEAKHMYGTTNALSVATTMVTSYINIVQSFPGQGNDFIISNNNIIG